MKLCLDVKMDDVVRVRLTEKGHAQYEKYRRDLDMAPKLKPDADGWCEFQLWNLIQIFGMMYAGNPKDLFIGNLVRIQTS